jgi:hypothetical protein
MASFSFMLVLAHAVIDAADTLPAKALEVNPGDRVLYVALGEARSLLPVIQSMLPGK